MRWRGLWLAVVAGVATLMWLRTPSKQHGPLPPHIEVFDVARELTTLDGATVVQQDGATPVRIDWMRTNQRKDGKGEMRRVLLTPPPARVRYDVEIPADGVLQLGLGVGEPRDDGRREAVIFTAQLDGQEIFRRVVDPARNGNRDDRWLPERIPLPAFANRNVVLELSAVTASGAPTTAPAGWSRMRLLSTTSVARQASSVAHPNVLVLLIDTLRADALGAYGARPSPSPAFDALAQRGVLFEQAISQAPWTIPSVATFFTGLHPPAHGVIGGPWKNVGTGDPERAVRWQLAENIPTLAELAQRAGVSTLGITANNLVSHTTGLARGFERWKEPTGAASATRFARADVVNDTLLDWLRANRTQRFFGYLQYMDVHSPYTPPSAFLPPDDPTLPADVRRGEIEPYSGKPNPLAPQALTYLRARYDGAIRYLDGEIDRLLHGLQTLDLDRSTVVIILADHGESFGEHTYVGHTIHLYDEVLHIPLLLLGPGIGAPRRVAQQAQGIDLLPTIAALLDITPPAHLPGHDLLAPHPDEPAFSHTALWRAANGERTELLSLRTPGWKLIHEPGAERSEWYDLAQDPHEHRDQFATRTDGTALAAALRHRHQSARREHPALTAAASAPAKPELRGRLEALGYIAP